MDLLGELENRRRRLRMPRNALAKRAGVSLPSLHRMLVVRDPGCSWASVLRVAEALGMSITAEARLSPQQFRHRQATKKAERLVSLLQGTSSLEGQGLDREELDDMVIETAAELMTSKRKLWAE